MKKLILALTMALTLTASAQRFTGTVIAPGTNTIQGSFIGPNTYRAIPPYDASEVQNIIAANISNNVPTSILLMGDSEANSGSAQNSIFDNTVGLASILFNQYGYSGGGPDFNVDLGLNPSIWARAGSFTNWFGNFVTPVSASDGTNAVRSKFSSAVMRTNAPTQLGIDYIANSAGGNISIMWTNELGISQVLAGSGNAATPTYKRLLFNYSGVGTNNQIFFTSVSQTNILLGFVFINTNIPGVQCWSAAQGGISLSNMFTAGASSLQAFGQVINPDLIFYTGKDNEGGSMGSIPYVISTYQSNLLNVLTNIAVAKTRVVYVTTPQQNGNFDNITQNNFARLIAFTNNWLWCDLGQFFPNWDVNNNGGMMLDTTHPNAAGSTIWAQTLASLSGVKGNNGSNTVYYGTLHGNADGLSAPIVFNSLVSMPAGLVVTDNPTLKIGTNVIITTFSTGVGQIKNPAALGNTGITLGSTVQNIDIDTSSGVNGTLSSGGTVIMFWGGSSGAITANANVVPNGNLSVGTSGGPFQNGFYTNLSTLHIIGAGGSTTIVTNAGAGTSGATVSISGTDVAGNFTVNSGLVPPGASVICTITWSQAYPSAPKSIVLTPANAATALLSGVTMVFPTPATGNFTVTSGATGIGASTTYKWYYTVIQ